MRPQRLFLALILTIVALLAAAYLVVEIGDLHARLDDRSPYLADGVVILVVATFVALAATSARLFWKIGPPKPERVLPPIDVVKAAELQAEHAERVIAMVKDESAKVHLGGELAALRTDAKTRQFHVVVFGTGSAGKTSLINALIGEPVGKTEAVMGTTRVGEVHTHTLEDVDGTLLLTDTPGLSEVGEGGAARESTARDLAARADLLLFVLDHDLIRTEIEPLAALARQGKRSIVVLNKRDRFPEDDVRAILAKLRQRLDGIVPAGDVVAVAAAPRPVAVRVRLADGTTATELETEPPDLSALLDRIEVVLEREGDALRAGNLLLRAHLIGKAAQEQLTRQRRDQAKSVIERFQWITAGTVFANPIPAFDLMATGAVQFQMISELAAVYGVELSTAHVRMIGGQMIQLLLKLGMVEAASSLIAGIFKSSLVGYGVGGAVQATTMAYLTRISGLTFHEYFERGQTWGDGGMQAALVRQFDLNSRADFLKVFARQAVDRVVSRVLRETDKDKDKAPTPKG